MALFQPTVDFGIVSTDGVNSVRFPVGVDDKGQPFYYVVPDQLAQYWQDDYKWGKIVELQSKIVDPTIIVNQTIPNPIAPKADAPAAPVAPPVEAAPTLPPEPVQAAPPPAAPAKGTLTMKGK